MERKEMVKILSEYFEVEAKYLGVPSCAYEIRTEDETYTIDRQGVISKSNGEVISMDEILNPETGINQNLHVDEQEYNEIEIALPLEDHTVISLSNIINMLSSKQHLIMKAFKTDKPFLDESFAEELSSKEISTIEDLKEAYDHERCPGILIDYEQDRIVFKLKAEGLTQEKIETFRDLIFLINVYAKKLKWTSFKKAQEDNPKYALRTYLLRLGMIGEEYKNTRKVLLSNLEGSGAFRKVCNNEG